MNFALRGDSLFAWLMAIGVGVIAAGVGFLVREFRRAGRILAHTGEQSAPGNAPF